MARTLTPPALRPASPMRGLRWWAVVAVVIAVHALVTSWWSAQWMPIDPRLREPQRIQAAYTRQVQLADTAPASVAPPPPRPPAVAPRRAPPLASAASAAEAIAPPASAVTAEPPPLEAAASTPAANPVESVAVAASAPELPPAASAALQAQAAASEPPAIALAASAASSAPLAAAPSFDWPASTRISYQLTGWYRGDVEGSAQVEWLREGNRYQVHVDVVIGPSFAPLGKRRMSSEGEITAAGLVPKRYEQVTSQIIGSTRTLQMLFEGDQVQLVNGQRVPRPANTQDTASQFVQLIWLFTTQPGLLAVGRAIEMPLALPRRIERFVYDVVEEERLASRFGEIPTLHVKPRRAIPLPGDLSIEMWFAPRLQNLPVRFVIRQDESNFVDLRIDRLPEQAAPEAPARPAPQPLPPT